MEGGWGFGGGGFCERDVCVCVVEVQTGSFNAIVSSMKCVGLQFQKCSFPAQTHLSVTTNTLTFCSVILYSEVSSRGYLVAISESVCLQCDIVYSEVKLHM